MMHQKRDSLRPVVVELYHFPRTQQLTMCEEEQQVNLVQEASTRDAAIIARILADGGVPTALGGVMAATHYGGGLCPLVRKSINVLSSP